MRVTQEDPIGVAGGLNLYGFASGDPVNHSDPFGTCDDPKPCPSLMQQFDAALKSALRDLALKIGEFGNSTQAAITPTGSGVEVSMGANRFELGGRSVEPGVGFEPEVGVKAHVDFGPAGRGSFTLFSAGIAGPGVDVSANENFGLRLSAGVVWRPLKAKELVGPVVQGAYSVLSKFGSTVP